MGSVFRISNGPDPGRTDVDADPYFLIRRIHRRNSIHESYSLSRSLVRNLFDDFMIPFPSAKCNKISFKFYILIFLYHRNGLPYAYKEKLAVSN